MVLYFWWIASLAKSFQGSHGPTEKCYLTLKDKMLFWKYFMYDIFLKAERMKGEISTHQETLAQVSQKESASEAFQQRL